MHVWLDSTADGIDLLQQVPEWVEEIEQALSRFRPESELSRLNHQIGSWVRVSPPMFDVILQAKHAARSTGGLYTPLILGALIASGYDRSFDLMAGYAAETTSEDALIANWHDMQIDIHSRRVWLPGEIDLGGIAKGWTAQWIANRLSDYGACMVDAGGDIVTRGKYEWDVIIADPFSSEPIASVQIRDAAVATSGTDYRRWLQGDRLQHHLIDPRTAQSAVTDVISATVIHPDGPTAEAYAKALVVLGAQPGLEWLQHQWDGTGLVVQQDRAVLMTPTMENYLRRI
ncbi:MAG TPA: FAD:protein FMN transferase [Aggregatilineaceae bacterium]|nr:FAD:protein FMN transferase [Aggregatilineaceae bacterium]